MTQSLLNTHSQKSISLLTPFHLSLLMGSDSVAVNHTVALWDDDIRSQKIRCFLLISKIEAVDFQYLWFRRGKL